MSINENDEKRRQFQERYETGNLPWDAPLPPPEVCAAVAKRRAGRALDLGCGHGRAAIYLAEQGWDVDGVDFVPLAIEEARRRAAAADVAVNFHAADVTNLDFLNGPYDLALDVGCAHSLDAQQVERYRNELGRLLRPGALYLLFARIGDADSEERPQPLDVEPFRQLFSKYFVLSDYSPDQTDTDEGGWPSAWFWFIRW